MQKNTVHADVTEATVVEPDFVVLGTIAVQHWRALPDVSVASIPRATIRRISTSPPTR